MVIVYREIDVKLIYFCYNVPNGQSVPQIPSYFLFLLRKQIK